MKKNSTKYIYDLAKRFRYGLMTKDDIKRLAEKSEEDLFIERLSSEMDDAWKDLEEAQLEKIEVEPLQLIFKQKYKYRRIRIAIASIAAIAVIAIIAFPLFNKDITSEQIAIVQFANDPKNLQLDEVSETQLILSDDETIILGEESNESQVRYDDENIAVEDKLVAKKSVSSFNQLVTARGKRSQLTLSDGTKIWINSATRVVYPTQFSEDVREIYVDGEIYIEVAKEKTRQFIVNTRDFSIQVLGTKFNVSSYEKNSKGEVVLVEGKVSVKREETKSDPIIMNPNELLEIGEMGEKVRKVNTTKYTSWTQGLYYLENETLEQVLTFLSQYYGVNIQCDPEIVGMRCSGKIDLKEDVNRVLDILFTSYKLSYVKHGDDYYISKK